MRVATWNIQHGRRADARRADLDAVAATCASFGADVIALQEVDRRTRRVQGRDPLPLVAEATGLTIVDGAVLPHGGGTYGNALLVRGDPDDVRHLALHRPRWPFWRRPEPRGAVRCRVGELTVATCHLSVEGRPLARRQLRDIVRWLDDASGPTVLLGDLNLRDPDPGDGWSVVDVPPAFPSRAPRITIDHVLLRGCCGSAVEYAQQPVVSDHRPIVVEVGQNRW